MEHFIDCLNRLHENLYQVTLTGGEPLVFAPDVLRIAEEAKKLDVPMIVVTNAALLTEGFLSRFSELGHVLVISLDTMDRGLWEDFRGREHYDRVMGNLMLARSILGGKLRIQSVLARESQRDVACVAEYCREHRIPHAIQPYMDFGGTWHSAGEYRDTGGTCAARKNICIYPNGDVVKCFDHHRIPLAREPLGNVAKDDIITILCKRRATEVSRLMKTCNFPCKQLSCNQPAVKDTPARADMPDVVVIRGAPGAGKSSAAKRLAALLRRGTRIEVDTLRAMIIPVDWSSQAEHIGVLSLATHLVAGFLALGHRPVIVVDTFSGNKLVRFIAELQALRRGLDVRLFALVPTASALRARVESRPDGEFKDILVSEKLNADTVRFLQPGERLIDNSALSVEETAHLMFLDCAGGRRPCA